MHGGEEIVVDSDAPMPSIIEDPTEVPQHNLAELRRVLAESEQAPHIA